MTSIKVSSLVKNKQPSKITRVTRPEDDFDFEPLLGPTLLLTNSSGDKESSSKQSPRFDSKPTKSLLENKELILLYFTASWVKESRETIDEALIRFYNAAAKDNEFEIVLVSSDGIVEEFEGHFAKMPWLSIPSAWGSAGIKMNLSNMLGGIRDQPLLIVVDAKTGEYVPTPTIKDDIIRSAAATDNGEDDFATTAKVIVNGWKTSPREPLSEVGKAGRSKNPVVRFLLYIAENPLLIFGILSVLRLLRHKWLDWYLESGRRDSSNIPPVITEDSEF